MIVVVARYPRKRQGDVQEAEREQNVHATLNEDEEQLRESKKLKVNLDENR